jgi:glycosyltransferase involved in cell wall biosynthesis
MTEPIVCVPARNEAARLPVLLRALQYQTWIRAQKRPLRVVVVLNNCTDESRTVVEQVVGNVPQISLHLVDVSFLPEQAHVGSARRLAMNTAASLVPDNSLLLSTDVRCRTPGRLGGREPPRHRERRGFGRWAHRGK